VPGSSNQLAIELLVTHIKRQLDSRSLRFRKLLGGMGGDDEDEKDCHPSEPDVHLEDEGVTLIEQTNQLLVGKPSRRNEQAGTDGL
jgi:uridine kinase